MGLVVQKYGGTSVGSVERIQAVAQRILGTIAQGHQVVVVVSAMGKTTDSLVQLAQDITDTPSVREMDMLLATGEQVSIALLSMALQTLGQPARSMTGFQAGIITEKHHGRARILEIKTERIHHALNQGEVVVVAGFQGTSVTDNLEITTLGRGGSDTSAVALAAALQADCCEIYTDVPGILSTDPRIVPEAQLMAQITCEEMLELASLGAKVLHPRAVEIARNYQVPLLVRSSWTTDPGTQVLSPSVDTVPRPLNNLEIARPVDGIEIDRHQAKVGILHVPDRPGIAAHLFGALSQAGINIDLIIQSIQDGQSNDIAFTVDETQLEQAVHITAVSLAELMDTGLEQVRHQIQSDETIAKVSISGAGMIGRPGVAAQMFAALAAAGANIHMISTSEIKVSCVLSRSDADAAIAALCQTFELEASSETRMGLRLADWGKAPLNAIPAVRGVALDENQAELAIRAVPDRPGMAAQIFGLLAKHLISVDMIIQSQRCAEGTDGVTRDIACTVSKADALTAQAVLTEAMKTLGIGAVEVNPQVAKVSIVGSGMVYQEGVAAKMFAALAQEQINIQMIGTSEIKTSCLVNEAQGKAAVGIIHKTFGLSA
ncbi:MAG: aspartate kinase [Prochlorotrichaceae cyanobacterium]